MKNIGKTRNIFHHEERCCGIDSIDKDAGSMKSTRSSTWSKMESIKWQHKNVPWVLLNWRPSITSGQCWMVPWNASDHEPLLTVPDPLNVLGNTTVVQRGSRQCWEGKHALLQLQPCRVCEMFSLPVWRKIPTGKEMYIYQKNQLAHGRDKGEVVSSFWEFQFEPVVQMEQITWNTGTDVTNMYICASSTGLFKRRAMFN